MVCVLLETGQLLSFLRWKRPTWTRLSYASWLRVKQTRPNQWPPDRQYKKILRGLPRLSPLTSSHSSSIKGKLPPRSLNPYLPSFINNSPLHPPSHIQSVEMASRIAPKFAQMAARPAAFRAVQPKVAQRAFSGKSSPPQRHLIPVRAPSKHRTILYLHQPSIHQWQAQLN